MTPRWAFRSVRPRPSRKKPPTAPVSLRYMWCRESRGYPDGGTDAAPIAGMNKAALHKTNSDGYC
jgi:hypothetical protein